MTEYRAITAEEFAPLAAIAGKYGAVNHEEIVRFADMRLKKGYDVWLLQSGI